MSTSAPRRDECLARVVNGRRVVIKIGTSLLTDSGRLDGVNRAMIEKLRDEIVFLREKGMQVMLVTSGSVGMGRQALRNSSQYTPAANPSVARRQALAAIGQSRLVSVYGEIMESAGIPVAQILVSARDFRDRRSYVNIGNTIEELIGLGVLPIVNENDTTSTDELQELRFGDNDMLSAACASLFQANLLVILTSVPGFLLEGERVPLISEITSREMDAAGGPEGPGVGGMTTKLQAAKLCMQSGQTLSILPGAHDQPIRALFAGDDVGTLFCSKRGRRMSARKRWLLYAKTSGTVVVDPGARKALVERGSSLLPAGIPRTSGRFLAGDVVDISDDQGNILGRGLVNYSYRELSPLLGLNGDKLRERGHVLRSEEVIHRNNLILESV